MNCGEMVTRNLLTDGNVQQGWASTHMSKTFLQFFVQVYNCPKVILSKKVFMSKKIMQLAALGKQVRFYFSEVFLFCFF